MTVQDYLPPYNDMVEQQVIGSMLVEPDLIGDIISRVKPTDFYLRTHQVICKAIFDIYEEHGAELTGVVEVTRLLVDRGQYSPDILQKMNNSMAEVVTTTTVDHYIEQLLVLSLDRQLKEIGAKIAATAPASNREALEEVMSEAESMITSISDDSISDDHMSDATDIFDRYSKHVEMICEKGNPITGVPTGIPDLDTITSGFQKSDLIILAGRPSMGKTAFAIQMAMGMRENGYKGIFFEIEMDEISVANRMVARNAFINSKLMQTGMLSKEERTKIKHTTEAMKEMYAGLRIDTTPNLSLAVMKAKARKLKRQGELDFIFVDYLQLITGVQGASRNEEVGKISRSLKLMARELEVPVIALAQLSRGVESRNDKRPLLSDLRDSGEIEQDADVIIFMYRDDYYNEESEEKNIAEAIISKHRNGALGTVKMLYKKEYNLFLPLEGYRKEEVSQQKQAQNEAAVTHEVMPWEEGEL